jgi:hypothetical protein
MMNALSGETGTEGVEERIKKQGIYMMEMYHGDPAAYAGQTSGQTQHKGGWRSLSG